MYEFAELGQKVISQGLLKQLRERLGWSMNAMAEVLHASPQTYTSWERRPDIRVWPASADRVGRFYQAAQIELDLLQAEGVDLKELIPFHWAASHLGVPQEVLLERHRAGELPAEDLGILGLWIRRENL
jgi:transcriptional regulator with XRE-family HTH domain